VAALPDATPDGDRADEGRILATLATLHAGAEPVDAAGSIAAWLEAQ